MRFLKAKVYDKDEWLDGKTELFNLNQVLTIQPNGEKTKILMGAGLWWWVYTDTIEPVECYNELKEALCNE